MHVLWRDGTSTWNILKDVRNSYPTQLAEFALQNNFASLPVFKYWIYYAINKKHRIIKKINSKYWTWTHKYGIRIPKTVKEAYKIDQENNNHLWRDALKLEMKGVRAAFEIFDGKKEDLPNHYQKINCHVTWDVKLGENFRRKAILVTGGHVTIVQSHMIYSSVVSRDSVRIALTIAALNELIVLACNIKNAYLTADFV